MRKSEDSFQLSFISFHHVGLETEPHVSQLGSKYCHPPSHFGGLQNVLILCNTIYQQLLLYSQLEFSSEIFYLCRYHVQFPPFFPLKVQSSGLIIHLSCFLFYLPLSLTKPTLYECGGCGQFCVAHIFLEGFVLYIHVCVKAEETLLSITLHRNHLTQGLLLNLELRMPSISVLPPVFILHRTERVLLTGL